MGTPEFTPPVPIRLQWDLNAKCIEAIEQSYQVYNNNITKVLFLNTIFSGYIAITFNKSILYLIYR